ncbi:glycosyltransferase family 2 protein [Arcobacter sp.]|uniref:glycosyltransferase family 2 protein n=1 Tax=Arcobacter sp. TaxID=1872629 RepID=UPI003D0DCE0D
MNNPKLTIGMPVYNGELFIEDALKSLLSQSYKNFELIISDNNSTDNTENICKKYSLNDQRIKYIKQHKNIGAHENFMFVLKDSETNYFMWAAADDLWDSRFLEKCMQAIDKDHNLGYVFSNIYNINILNKKYREIPSFVKYSGEPSLKKIYTYLLDAEFNGKANLFYGIYNSSLLKEMIKKLEHQASWGLDMNFNLLTLCSTKTYIIDDILFYKKRHENIEYFTYKDNITLRNKFKIHDFLEYYKTSLLFTYKNKYFPIVFLIMTYRLCEFSFFKIKGFFK